MKDPVEFCKYNANTYRHAKWYLEKYKHLFKFTANEDVLEIGCATGKITREVLFPFIEDYVLHLRAVDVCEGALEVANRDYGHSKLSYQYLDITDEGKCNTFANTFQHVFAFNCFHFVKKAETWVNNTYKMLVSTGQLFASIVLGPEVIVKATTAQRMEKNTPWAKHLELFEDQIVNYGPKPDKFVGNILKNAGFAIDALQILRVRHSFPDNEHLNRTLLSLNGFLSELPMEFRTDYEADFLSKARESVEFAENGECNLYTDVLLLLVTKPPMNNN